MVDNPVSNKKFILVKDMADAVDGLYGILPDGSRHYKHAFLVRNPIRVFKSWKKTMFEVLPQVTNQWPAEKERTFENFHVLNDVPDMLKTLICFEQLYNLWKHVKTNIDPNPVVIDSDDLLTDPATMLEKFCAATGFPYTDELLKWDRNPDSINGWISAFSPLNDFQYMRSFCRTLFHSTQFLPPSPLPSQDTLTQDIRECVERAMPFYQEMYDARI